MYVSSIGLTEVRLKAKGSFVKLELFCLVCVNIYEACIEEAVDTIVVGIWCKRCCQGISVF
jgi:hypothetical protein